MVILGCVFHFLNTMNKESSVIIVEFRETTKEFKLEKHQNWVMKITLKTNENPHIFFTSLHECAKEFILKWITPNISEEIEIKVIRKSFNTQNSPTLSDSLVFSPFLKYSPIVSPKDVIFCFVLFSIFSQIFILIF